MKHKLATLAGLGLVFLIAVPIILRLLVPTVPADLTPTTPTPVAAAASPPYVGEPSPIKGPIDTSSLSPTHTPTETPMSVLTDTPTHTPAPIDSPAPTATPSPTPSPTPTSTPTLDPTLRPPGGMVQVDQIYIRSGPGMEFPSIGQLRRRESFTVTGRNMNPRGELWFLIGMEQNGSQKWIMGNSKYVEYWNTGNVAQIVGPSAPTPTPRQVLASNKRDFSGKQGSNGWAYLMEDGGRNSGRFRTMPRFDGRCWRTDTWENDVRICEKGEVHPGQSTRIAYQWQSTVSRQLHIEVHAHKVDTRCGDGISVGTYKVIDDGSGPRKLGDFAIGGGDNTGKSVTYTEHFDQGNFVLVIVDIRRDSTCDMTRLFIKVY